MLPHQLPELPGFGARCLLHPASADLAVGGDWYDAYLVDPGPPRLRGR